MLCLSSSGLSPKPSSGTFKLKKVKLRNEGFDVRVVQDPLYLMDFSIKSYITLTKDLSDKVSAGFFKFN